MTQENVKEKLAIYHFSLLAASQYCKTFHHDWDDGVDLGIDKSLSFPENGKTTHRSLGRLVELQFKTTTVERVQFGEKTLKFDLDASTFNKLCHRKEDRALSSRHVPLLLILCVLPAEASEWVKMDKEKGLTMAAARFFWFVPADSSQLSQRKSWQRIHVPMENEIGLNFFDDVFTLLF